MPSEQELEETYSRTPTPDLLQIMAKKADYTDLAVSIASAELKKRNVKVEEKTVTPISNDPYKSLWMENCLYELGLLPKVLFYFLFLPVLIIYRLFMRWDYILNLSYLPSWLKYRSNGYLLKSQQRSYYQVTAFIFMILATIASSSSHTQASGTLFWAIWVGGFILSFLYEAVYNKQRLIDKLECYKRDGELPWGI